MYSERIITLTFIPNDSHIINNKMASSNVRTWRIMIKVVIKFPKKKVELSMIIFKHSKLYVVIVFHFFIPK